MKPKIRPVVCIATSLIGAAIVVLVLWTSARPRSLRDGWFDKSQNVLPDSSKKILESGERFVLYSLFPTSPDFPNHSVTKPEMFHNYAVLGKTEIQNQSQRTELLRALYKGIADSDGKVAACFNPRHGISATHGGGCVDLVICFECLSLETYTGSNVNQLAQGSFLTTDSPRRAFNQALEKAHLPIAKE